MGGGEGGQEGGSGEPPKPPLDPLLGYILFMSTDNSI